MQGDKKNTRLRGFACRSRQSIIHYLPWLMMLSLVRACRKTFWSTDEHAQLISLHADQVSFSLTIESQSPR